MIYILVLIPLLMVGIVIYHSYFKKENKNIEEENELQYSYIKDFYIETKDYTYFHNPSRTGQIDKRFIGREALISRLKSLLTSSETSSGAYLITGFRGMGKSSLVSKVLNDIGPKTLNVSDISRFFRALFFIVIFTFSLEQLTEQNFNRSETAHIALKFILIAIISISTILFYDSRLKDDLKQFKPHTLFFRKLLLVFVPKHAKYSKANLYYFFQDFNIILCSFAINLIVYWEIKYKFLEASHLLGESITLPFFLLVGFTLGLILIAYVINHATSLWIDAKAQQVFQRKTDKEIFVIVSQSLLKVPYLLYKKIKNILSHSGKINIKINLGHESLKELDILRLIVKQSYENYRKVNKLFWHFPLGLLSNIPKFLIIFFLTHLFYSAGNNYHKELKEKTGFSYIFPSQNFSYPENIGIDSTKMIKNASKSVNQNVVFINSHFDFIIDFFVFVDLTIQNSYSKIIKSLFGSSYSNHGKIDYLWIIYFTIILLIVNKSFTYGFFGLPTHRSIRKRFAHLQDRIQAQLHKETGGRAGGKSSLFGFFRTEKKVYPIAEVREIESELLSIFNDIQRVPRIFNKVEFVFVFDELDKIEANQNTAISEKEEEEAFYNSGEFSSSEEETRRRRRAVAKILANLKHFFTSAQVKFIFIAGRELYDAALADISDRNYFLGSIFNDVIYVSSFLIDEEVDTVSPTIKSDSNHTFYDNSLIEKYICNYLIPSNFLVGHSRSLKTFYKYCKYSYGEDIVKTEADDSWENKQNKEITYHAICTLRKFILYLSYRSNGSPKKLTFLFEKYLVTVDKKDLLNKVDTHKAIVLGKNSRNFFLHFTSNDLYTFSLINYLTTPYTYQIARNIQRYNDKLRVSTTYLLDHIFKYHNFGFSWRNLELTPEIIDINKAPVLRGIIQDIIKFLQSNQLESVLSGLYDFKFNKKISNEFIYLSKINESESAAFNFTLDESQEIKKHYYRKLNKLLSKYTNDLNKKNHFIHSVSFIQGILGDLHYYDQEYDDAIIAYKDSVQSIREVVHTLPLDQTVVYTRLMLKLSLALEKRKSFASSLRILDELTNRIRDRFLVNLQEIGLEETLVNAENTRGVKLKYDRDKLQDSKSSNQYFKYDGWYGESFSFHKPKPNDKEEIDDFDMAEYILNLPTTKKHSELISIVQSATSMRLLLQPFIAKLHLKEKEKIGGITYFDIKQYERELSFLMVLIPKEEKKLIRAEYYNKLGDLLFFKNSLENNSCHAIKYYILALNEIVETKSKDKLCFIKIAQFIRSGYTNANTSEDKNTSQNQLNAESSSFAILANTLGDLGDSYLTNHKESRDNNHPRSTSKINKDDLDIILQIIDEFLDDNILLGKSIDCKTFNFYKYYKLIESEEKVISYSKLIIKCCVFYILSSKAYLINNEPKKSANQLLRILYILEDSTKRLETSELEEIERVLLKRFLELIYLTYDSSSRSEFEKFKQLFKWKHNLSTYQYKTITSSLPAYTDIQEGLAVYNMMAVRSEELRKKHLTSIQNLVSFHSGSIFSRNLVLISKIKYNYYSILDIIELKNGYSEENRAAFENKIDSLIEDNKYSEIRKISMLITDAIFCCTEVLINYKSLDKTRSTPYSTIANLYHRRAWWIGFKNFLVEKMEYFQYSEFKTIKKILFVDLRALIGPNSMSKLKVKYNGDNAMNNYLKCLEVHEGKQAYNNIGNDMYYLDDDYNDEHYHFHTALERNRVNTNRLIDNFNGLRECMNGKKHIFPHRSNSTNFRESTLHKRKAYF